MKSRRGGMADTIGLEPIAGNRVGVRVPPAAPNGYIPGTSLTLHSGHIVYTFEAYISSQKEKRYALEGNLCDG